MEERLQKIISKYGVASRRQAEKLLIEGRVRVNGNTAHLGDVADEHEDVIEVDGVRLKKQISRTYIMLNKPRGYVTTLKDEQGRKDVSQLVSDCPQRVYPVGRLDRNSEGLLLLTNDGDLANRLMHPSGTVIKVYHLWVSGYHFGAEEKLKESILIDGRMTNPAEVRLVYTKDTVAMLEVTLSEGRNRQIRRLCEHALLTVTRLKRVQEGPLLLGDLPVGTWRELTTSELELILKE